MSRLDSVIDRLMAQRACLDAAAAAVSSVPGPVLELGLGNGRTYDHLRARLPGRRIFVFERQVNAHPDCIPPDEDLFLGDFMDHLPEAMLRIGEPAALVHADIGTGDKQASMALAATIGSAVVDLMASGGLLLADQPFGDRRLAPAALPDGVKPGRYHMFRKTDA
ncbi:MAG: class I SAM-dependent methyltransferase [Minwuia sp.]|uniref:class I SAM-dependent methyltransferase n=1 Tax=Minwuia sp. TaxID=2493630 RepID=UPI003A863CE6